MTFHVAFSSETLHTNGTLKLRWRTTFIDHVPTQQFFSIDSFVEMATTVWTNCKIRHRTPV